MLATDANVNICKLAIKSALNDIEADGFLFFSFQGQGLIWGVVGKHDVEHQQLNIMLKFAL